MDPSSEAGLSRADAFGDVAVALLGDLRNLLAPVSMGTEFLARRLAGSQPLGPVAEDAHAAASLAGRLLRHAHEYLHRPPASVDGFAPAELLQDLERVLQLVAGERVRLAIDSAHAPDVKVAADRIAVERILLNLVGHARDLAPAGSVVSITASALALDDADATRFGCQHRGWHVGLHTVFVEGTQRFAPSLAIRRLAESRGWGLAAHHHAGTGVAVSLYLPCGEVKPCR